MWLLKVNIPRSVLSSWFLVPGFWFLVLGSWFLVLGSRFSVPGSWFLVLGYSVQRLKSPLEGFSPGVHLRGRCHGDRIGGRPARSVLSGAVSTARLSSYLGSRFSKCYSSSEQRSIAILYGGKMWRPCAL
jgi:hypothetical protein